MLRFSQGGFDSCPLHKRLLLPNTEAVDSPERRAFLTFTSMQKLYIDIETFSSEPIKDVGSYKYMESLDFEIQLLSFAHGDDPVTTLDLAQGETIPKNIIRDLTDPKVLKSAFNATFERNAFRAIGIEIPVEQWQCTLVKSAYCGLPLSLDQVSKALKLGDKAKLDSGKALIRYFSMPCKPTKRNGGRERNLPHHDLEKWEEYKRYNAMDVVAEREIDRILEIYALPTTERKIYALDQKINDRGIEIDDTLARSAIAVDQTHNDLLIGRMKEITGLDNPNSGTQLRRWLETVIGKEVKSIAKDKIEELQVEVKAADWGARPRPIKPKYTAEDLEALGYIEAEGGGYHHKDRRWAGLGVGYPAEEILERVNYEADATKEEVLEVLDLRLRTSKTSIKKYQRMLDCQREDGRARGLFQFYGANRTGRWAGRLIQLQNLPRNYLKDLDQTRDLFRTGDYEMVSMAYDDISDRLSQLIRTAFVPKRLHTFAIADFSAIEARVIAWLADETWRLEVFRTHGKIYEASAAAMFDVPMDKILAGEDFVRVNRLTEEIETLKAAELRQRGKVAELALGYQGATGALTQMGAVEMGLTEDEMWDIVERWREKSPNIVKLWRRVENAALKAVRYGKKVVMSGPADLVFNYDGTVLTIQLPSGRKLFYQNPQLVKNKWGKMSIKYRGIDQTSRRWSYISSYGGKFVENIIQAIARDLLVESMLRLDEAGFEIVMHVHDEVVAEIFDAELTNQKLLNQMCDIMGQPVEWAPGLPLKAEGFISKYFKKD